MPSYSSATQGLGGRFREALALYRIRTQNTSTSVNQLVDEAEAFERIIVNLRGIPLEGRSILEVGPGHFLVQAYYFARKNDVTTIDTDVIPIGMNPLVYLSMFVHNGLRRSVKTIIRKAMGIDARHRKYLKVRLVRSTLPTVRVLRGNVCHLDFPDCSFDVVLCRSVLHHIGDPSLALSEMARVLRFGGVVIANFHLYTSHNGSLDPRVLSGDYDDSLLWAHLRSPMAANFEGNSFLNKMRLNGWREALFSSWPGCTVETEKSSRAGIEESAKAMIDSGSISDHGLEELTTHTVLAFWQKPPVARDPN
jgi:SAM-dependent methyltransferase